MGVPCWLLVEREEMSTITTASLPQLPHCGEEENPH
jgi:hypothetical protein